MKIVPLFDKDMNSNSSKLLAIEPTTDINLEKINKYKTVSLNCNFSSNYLNRLLKLNKFCTIIFNDLKLLLSNKSYYLKTSNFCDGYKIIFSVRKSKFTKFTINYETKIPILRTIFEDSKFFLDCEFSNCQFTNIVNVLNILYEYHKLDHSLRNDILSIELYIESVIKKYFKKENKKIIKILSYLENENKLTDFFNILIEKLKDIEFEDSLLAEVINMIPKKQTKSNFYDFNYLLKFIELNDKSKNLLGKLKLDKVNDNSIELYSSVITRTHWVEELEYGNIMGLLLSINPKEINKNAYNLDYIPINEITHTIIGFDQILEAYKMNETGDLYGSVMSGYGVGEGNCILPLYINNEHWKFVRLYLDYNLGIIFNRNPLLFNNSHRNVYKNVLIKMINLTFSNDDYKSDKWINLLFSVLRTNYELFKNDKNFVKKFINDKKFRVTCNLNNILIDYLFFDKDNNCINIIFEELIRRTFKSLYKNIDVLDNIYRFNLHCALNYVEDYDTYFINDLINEEEFGKWISELELNYIFSEKITLIYAIIKMKEIIHTKDFFDKFDKNCGILDEDNLNYVKEFVLNKKIIPENSELVGLLNPKFSRHVNLTKDKIFSINTFIKLNLVENDTQLHNIFIQGLLQRVDKCRKKALSSNKVQNPFKENDIIKSVGLLVAQRFIKKYFDLNGNNYNYFKVLNSIDDELLKPFVEMMIKKTISVRKYILNAITNILDVERRDIVRAILQ
jgi:hypothetical protein